MLPHRTGQTDPPKRCGKTDPYGKDTSTGQKLPSSQVIACEFWCSICRVFGSGIDSAFYCIMLPNFCANLADSSSGAIMSRRVACRHRLAARDYLLSAVRYPPISPAPNRLKYRGPFSRGPKYTGPHYTGPHYTGPHYTGPECTGPKCTGKAP